MDVVEQRERTDENVHDRLAKRKFLFLRNSQAKTECAGSFSFVLFHLKIEFFILFFFSSVDRPKFVAGKTSANCPSMWNR